MTDFLEVQYQHSGNPWENRFGMNNRFIYLLQLILILMDRAKGLFVAVASFSVAFLWC